MIRIRGEYERMVGFLRCFCRRNSHFENKACCCCETVSGVTWKIKGSLVTRFIMGIPGVTIWVIGVINLLTKSL